MSIAIYEKCADLETRLSAERDLNVKLQNRVGELEAKLKCQGCGEPLPEFCDECGTVGV